MAARLRSTPKMEVKLGWGAISAASGSRPPSISSLRAPIPLHIEVARGALRSLHQARQGPAPGGASRNLVSAWCRSRSYRAFSAAARSGMVSRSQTRIDRSVVASEVKIARRANGQSHCRCRPADLRYPGRNASVSERNYRRRMPVAANQRSCRRLRPRQQTQTGARASVLEPRTDRGGHGGGSRLPKRDLLPVLRSHLSGNLLPFA